MRILAFTILLAFPMSAVAQVADEDAVAAVRAASDAGWDAAYAVAQDDAVARDVVTWLRLREGAGVFADYATFVATHPDWPGIDRIRARGEEAMEKGADPALVLAWFARLAPETGEGTVRLAEALMAVGEVDRAQTVLKEAWVGLRLTSSGHDAMIAAFGDILAESHVARTDALLWRWRTTEAQRMLPLLDEDHQAWVKARVAYIRKAGDPAALAAEVPDGLKNDPGLAYDRYNWLADKGERTDAVAILLARSTSAEALGEPFRWSGWRRSLARWEMREGRFEQAYQLASQHFLTEGSSYADLEWLSGYLALRYLEKPALALQHFEAFEAAVESPISVGRAGYWIGRTQEVLGDIDAAQRAFDRAAQEQTGFYGLLAAERLGRDFDPTLTGSEDFGAPDEVLKLPLVQAAFTLLEGGQRGAAVLFFAQIGRQLDRQQLGQLGAVLNDMDEQYYEVLLGKTAAARGMVIPSLYFPIHDLAQMDLPVPAALSLSIARRESEFNAGIGSPVGALGLMQLMPGTAEEVAGILGLDYSKSKLTSDWAFNAQLGSKYLAMLREQFGYSPVMMAAGYNAGPSRPEIWMDERGDPRVGEADVVDWIEHIPFRETRNYVMRVTESIPVYEARLTGEVGPVRFMELLIGDKPILRPMARPEAQVVASDVPAAVAPAAPRGPVGPVSVRPIARPGG